MTIPYWKTCASIAGALALVTGLAWADLGRVTAEAEAAATTSPLYGQRLEEMVGHFDGAPAPASRQTTPALRQAFIFPSEAVSGCVGSACIASGCIGSVCAGSGCGGSVCEGSGCAGVCGNRPEIEDPALAMAGGVYCPLEDGDELATARFTGFEVTPTAAGIELRWAAAGAPVERYRVYRHEPAGAMLVTEGRLTQQQLVRVIDRGAGPAAPAVYVVEVVDALGRVTRATTGGERQALRSVTADARVL